ncbi:MAG: hypothetical protein ACRDBG_25970 [Waterburya sp.]
MLDFVKMKIDHLSGDTSLFGVKDRFALAFNLKEHDELPDDPSSGDFYNKEGFLMIHSLHGENQIHEQDYFLIRN